MRTLIVLLLFLSSVTSAEVLKIGISPQLNVMFSHERMEIENQLSSAGISFTVKEYPEARLPVLLKAGDIDAEMFREDIYQRELSNVVGSEKIIASTSTVLLTKDSNASIPGDFNGRKVTILRGATVLEERAKELGLDMVLVSSFENGLKMLKADRVDAVVMPIVLASAFVLDDLTIVSEPFIEVDFRFWVREGSPVSIDQINQALQ